MSHRTHGQSNRPSFGRAISQPTPVQYDCGSFEMRGARAHPLLVCTASHFTQIHAWSQMELTRTAPVECAFGAVAGGLWPIGLER